MNRRPQKIHPNMQEEKNAKASESDLLVWDRFMLGLIGIWPNEDMKLRVTVNFIYILIHVALEYACFVESIGDSEAILINLSETTTYTMVLVKIMVFRNNATLKKMINAMTEDFVDKKQNNSRQRKIYATYTSISKTFHRMLLSLVLTTAILYYFKPLAGYFYTMRLHNGTITSFTLPYQIPPSIEVTKVSTYTIAYVYEVYTLHIVVFGMVGTDGLLITLTLHVCGELSVLADKIVNLKSSARNNNDLGIRRIVKRHIRLIWMVKEIDSSFTIVLLGQLLGSASLISLNAFHMIMNSERTETTSLLTFALYEASMLTFLYSYCFIGECLMKESKRVRDAFYLCNWYEMPPSQSRDLIICIARSQKPLYLTAGKFYKFSLENFTQIIKTSLAYLSVLRTMIV